MGQETMPTTGYGLAFWHEATTRKMAMSEEMLGRIANHPRFAEACLKSLKNDLDRQRGNPMMAKVTRDIARWVYGYLALYLDAKDGLTLSAIQDFGTEVGITSAGRAQAILIHMRLIGFIKPAPVQKDRRSKRYVPTPAMTVGFREIIRESLLALTLLEPEAAAAVEQLDDPEFFREYLIPLGEGMASVVRTAPPTPITLFANRNGGMMVLYKIFSSGVEGDVFPPCQPVPISVSSLAKMIGASRTHVLRLLRDAEANGYLHRDSDAQTVIVEKPLRDAMITHHCVGFVGNAICSHRAFAAMKAKRAAANVDRLSSLSSNVAREEGLRGFSEISAAAK